MVYEQKNGGRHAKNQRDFGTDGRANPLGAAAAQIVRPAGSGTSRDQPSDFDRY